MIAGQIQLLHGSIAGQIARIAANDCGRWCVGRLRWAIHQRSMVVRVVWRIVGHNMLLATAAYGAHVKFLALVLAIVATIDIDIRTGSGTGSSFFIRRRGCIHHRPSIFRRRGVVSCLLDILSILVMFVVRLLLHINSGMLASIPVPIPMPIMVPILILIDKPIAILMPILVLTVKTLDATCKHLLGSY